MVAFTSNIALAKPTNSELAADWIEGQEYYEDNNGIVQTKANITLQSYTPVMTATTTPPSVGAGVLRGEFIEVQGMILGGFVIEFLDPGVSSGLGEIGISLPVVADASYHTVATTFNATPVGAFSCIGEGYIFNDSNVNASGTVALEVCTVSGVSYVRMVTETFTGKTGRLVSNAQPASLGDLDGFAGNFMYKKA